MAIVTFQAKLYTGIRCLCVDKNIQANLSYAFTVGNYDIDFPPRPGNPSGDVPDLDVNGNPIIYPNIYPWRLRRAVADLQCSPTLTLTNEKLKTVGSGNSVNDGYFVTGQSYKIINVGDSDWNSISGEDRVDVAAVPGVSVARPAWITGDEFVAQNNGQVPFLSPPAAEEPDPANPDRRNATPKTGKAHLASWTIRSTLTCQFPTYVEIDIEKLGLPEGTDCIVYFEEGFLLEDKGNLLPSGGYEYPNAVQGAPSPRIDNFIQFRTPWYGLSFMNATFTRIVVPTRIKQLAASFPQALGSVTFRIRYNLGNLASLFVEDFSITPTVRKITESILTLYAFTGGGSQQWNPFNYRIRLFDCNAGTITFTQPDTAGNRVRFGVSAMTSSFTMNTNAVKETDINLQAFGNGAMNTVAVKTTSAVSNNNIVSSQSVSAVRTRDTASTMNALSSVSWNGNYIAGSSRATILSTTSLEQSFDFVLEVDTSKVVPLASGNYVVDRSVLLYLYGFNGTVFWGDGTSNTYNSTAEDNGNAFHTYAVDGIYTIRVRGTLNHFGMVYKDRDPDSTSYNDRPRYDRYLGYLQSQGSNNFGGYRFAFTKVKAWGDTGLNNLERAFYGMENLTSVPGDLLEPLTNLKETFTGCESLVFPSQISSWNVSAITSLESTFSSALLFNQNINSWNVSNVTSLLSTFAGCSAFNQPLSSWNTANVTTLQSTFSGCSVFNQNIDSWNVSNVTSLHSTFANARAFNQPLNSWNTSKVITWGGDAVTPTAGTFAGAWAFNQPLSNWVINAPGIATPTNGFRLVGMFYDARAFNQNINSWNVSRISRMDYMFEGALAFNQPLSDWDMTNVGSIRNMFKGASSFNQDIGMWRTINVNSPSITSVGYVGTFHNAIAFNQDLSKWCVSFASTLPTDFYTNTPNWNKTGRVPVWGTCPPYP